MGHNMTTEQEHRFRTDLTKMSGGEVPLEFFKFHDGFSAYFAQEISALRVANKYSTPCSVKQNDNGTWRVAIKNSMAEAA